MSETIWMMVTDFCSGCGCILDYFQADLCDDCREEEFGDQLMYEDEVDSDDWEPDGEFLMHYFETEVNR